MRRQSKSFALEKFGVYMTDLPVQNVTVPTDNRRLISAVGAEMHGDHPCVVLSVADDGRSAVVAPMTSAVDSRGGEKFLKPKKEWLRVVHQGRASFVCVEQIRMVDRARFVRMQEPLGSYDREQLESRIKFLFGVI